MDQPRVTPEKYFQCHDDLRVVAPQILLMNLSVVHVAYPLIKGTPTIKIAIKLKLVARVLLQIAYLPVCKELILLIV